MNRASSTVFEDITNEGFIGGYYSKNGVTHGLVGDADGFSRFDVRGAIETKVLGIDNQGDVVGSYRDGSGHQHGFTFIDGHLKTVDVPGSMATVIQELARNRDIIGSYTEANGASHGFEASKSAGGSSMLSTPGAYDIGHIVVHTS